jgi:hypothetical protein
MNHLVPHDFSIDQLRLVHESRFVWYYFES